MGYIDELRKLIGSRPIIMVGAGILVVDRQRRLLMGQRADNHSWGIPGGSMEPGESVEETARRETLEETGLIVGEMELFGVFSGPKFFYTYPNGDQVYNVSVVFQSSDYQGTLQDSAEHDSLRFFAADQLPEAISPPVRPIVAQWAARQIESKHRLAAGQFSHLKAGHSGRNTAS